MNGSLNRIEKVETSLNALADALDITRQHHLAADLRRLAKELADAGAALNVVRRNANQFGDLRRRGWNVGKAKFQMTEEGYQRALRYLEDRDSMDLLGEELSTDVWTTVALANLLYGDE